MPRCSPFATRRARIGNYRLTDATLYVTLEPCLMCVGALVHARVARAGVRSNGAEERRARLHDAALELPGLNHRFAVTGGILEDECRASSSSFSRTAAIAGDGRRGRRGNAEGIICRSNVTA